MDKFCRRPRNRCRIFKIVWQFSLPTDLSPVCIHFDPDPWGVLTSLEAKLVCGLTKQAETVGGGIWRVTNRTRAVNVPLQKHLQIQQAVCPNGPLSKISHDHLQLNHLHTFIFRCNYTAVIHRVSHFLKIWCLNSQLQYNNGRRYQRSVAHRR
jgi:hypothetical protein